MQLEGYSIPLTEIESIRSQLSGTIYADSLDPNLFTPTWFLPYRRNDIDILAAIGLRVQMDINHVAGDIEVDETKAQEFLQHYWEMGERYWISVRNQAREAVCGSDGLYQQERDDLQSQTRTIITVGVPLLISQLGLPPEAYGLAISIILLISKIGVQAFCEATT